MKTSCQLQSVRSITPNEPTCGPERIRRRKEQTSDGDGRRYTTTNQITRKRRYRFALGLFFVLSLTVNPPSNCQIHQFLYTGTNPTIKFTVSDQTTITEFSMWVTWPPGECGGSIPISRSSVTISGAAFSISRSSSNQKYTVAGTYKPGHPACFEGNYSMWDKDPWGQICTQSGAWTALCRCPVCPVAENSTCQLDRNFRLCQNHPNPFNPTTTIRYELPKRSRVALKVFNILGEEVTTLVDAFQEAGTQTSAFDASGLPSGVYFYRLTAGGFVETRKMVLVR